MMGPPPPKRQKRLADFHPKDDATEQSLVTTKSKTTSKFTSTKLKRPTRSNTTNTQASQLLNDWTVEEDSLIEPNGSKAPPSKKNSPKRTQAAARINGDKKGGLHAFLSKPLAKNQITHNDSTAKPPVIEDVEPEYDIEDISDYDSDKAEPKITATIDPPSNSTRLVLDRRKPNGSLKIDGDATERLSLSTSQRFKVVGRASSVPQDDRKSTLGEDRRPWAERFGPETLEELSVHKKKVSDVKSWLEGVFGGKLSQRLLILKGPSGSGKTATTKMLAKAMNLNISEWKTPTEMEFGSEGYINTYAQFDEFLNRSGHFNSLELASSAPPTITPEYNAETSASCQNVILVEELPNTFVSSSRALEQFRSSILTYLSSRSPFGISFERPESITPLILIITETHLNASISLSDTLTAQRLLGTTILSHPAATSIEFNPIAKTYLLKALDRVIKKEAHFSGRRRTPDLVILKKLAEQGDVRSAIGALEFLCIRSDDDKHWSGRVAGKSSQKGKQSSSVMTILEKESLEMVTQRETTLGLFHAVGKVVYNKRDDPDPNTTSVHPPAHLLPKHARHNLPQTNIDTLIDETGTDPLIFIAALHENYIPSCSGNCFLNSLDACSQILSDADVLSSELTTRFRNRLADGSGGASEEVRREEIAFQVASRGLIFNLPYPVERSSGHGGGVGTAAYRFTFPTSVRLWRTKEEIEAEIEGWRDAHSGYLSNIAAKDGIDGTRIGLETMEQLLIENLPYLTMVRRKGTATAARDWESASLNKITKLGMLDIHHLTNHDDDDDDNMEGVIGNDSSTHEVEKDNRSPLKKDSSLPSPPAGSQVMEEPMQKLYLSEDDIED